MIPSIFKFIIPFCCWTPLHSIKIFQLLIFSFKHTFSLHLEFKDYFPPNMIKHCYKYFYVFLKSFSTYKNILKSYQLL